MAYRLGIDLGTTNTVAAVAVDGAPAELVGLGVNTPQMRSMLFLGEDGRLLVGDSAASRGHRRSVAADRRPAACSSGPTCPWWSAATR